MSSAWPSPRLRPDRAVLACRVLEPNQWCRRCGCEGVPRDTVTRELAHEPLGWRPTTLVVTVRRYRCTGCGHVWRQDASLAAEPRAKLSRRGLRWALEAIVCQHLTVARVVRRALDLDERAQPLHAPAGAGGGGVVGDELEAVHQFVSPAKYLAA